MNRLILELCVRSIRSEMYVSVIFLFQNSTTQNTDTLEHWVTGFFEWSHHLCGDGTPLSFRCMTEFRTVSFPLVIFGLFTGSKDRLLRRTQERPPFHPELSSFGPARFPQTPFQCPRQRRLRSNLPASPSCHTPSPYVSQIVHRALYLSRIRPASDPVDSGPGAVFEDDLHPSILP